MLLLRTMAFAEDPMMIFVRWYKKEDATDSCLSRDRTTGQLEFGLYFAKEGSCTTTLLSEDLANGKTLWLVILDHWDDCG
jgi:hypothetical protein